MSTPGVSPFRRGLTGRFEALTALSALAYLGWSLVPVWYRSRGGPIAGAVLPPVSLNGWGGPTSIAAVLAAVAAPWVGVRTGREIRRRSRLVAIDAALAAVAFGLTVAGFLAGRPGDLGQAGPSWGLVVALAISLGWAAWAARGLWLWRASEQRHP